VTREAKKAEEEEAAVAVQGSETGVRLSSGVGEGAGVG